MGRPRKFDQEVVYTPVQERKDSNYLCEKPLALFKRNVVQKPRDWGALQVALEVPKHREEMSAPTNSRAGHRGTLHLRPRKQGGHRPRRAQGARDHSLGLSASLGPSRGEAVRQALPAPGAGQGGGRSRFHQLPQPGIRGPAHRLPAGAELG